MDYIAFDPNVFCNTIRWLCRTADQDALGMALPSTSRDNGRNVEIAAGRYVELAGHDSWGAGITLGRLSAEEWRARGHGMTAA